ncbi:MAG TPA: phospholipase C, phosphocholine-specific, partial [Phenylobacterium sp.]|nr:phospholipase C, phosphocholine-specific [Phenylobacterium sp.]
WVQANADKPGRPPLISPFPLNTVSDFRVMRVEGTPHNWFDAQAAWDNGRMGHWPAAKGEHAMGHFREEDLPFQYALAEAFTVCDAYHCSIQSGTNSNRLFLWTGTNDPTGRFGGPSLTNSHDRFVAQGGATDSYRWTTYPERLLAAGVTWRIYQDMADNFTDNSTAGFAAYRDSHEAKPGSDPRLAELALSTRKLDGLRDDVLKSQLPQVSWIVAPEKDSEHPGPSSPAQGADFTARVIEALTADPKVWARTVLFVNYDENDGFFDHVPPPAPPARDGLTPSPALGASTVDTTDEYHLAKAASEAIAERPDLMGRAYGLGPRVPMFVISPRSRGGWVNSQVFDHTSVIRFLEARFGVMEPNISPWRRAVCGDLLSAFDFKTPNAAVPRTLPTTKPVAVRAAALPGRTLPVTPSTPDVPVQATGVRLSRALLYRLQVDEGRDAGAIRLTFRNEGDAGAVFHVYDRLHLDRVPRRYTVGAGGALSGDWVAGAYDLWVLGPNGFHRHFIGDAAHREPSAAVAHGLDRRSLILTVSNPDRVALDVHVTPNAYGRTLRPWRVSVPPGASRRRQWPLAASHGWYDLSVRSTADGFFRRLAGRLEWGGHSVSDPAMGGSALMDQFALDV